LPREEAEEFVLPDRRSQASAELAEEVGVSRLSAGSAVPGLEGVQTRTVSRKEGAAVGLIAAALGSDLNLSAGEAPILGIVGVGDDLHLGDRLFRGRDDGRAAPHRAGGADAVDRNAVVLVAQPAGHNLRAVLRRKDSLVYARG